MNDESPTPSPAPEGWSESPAASAAPRTATDLLWQLLISAVLLGIIGGVLTALTWPHATVSGSGFYASREDHGSAVGVVIGLIIAGIGQMLGLVSIIGFGVKLGVQARDDQRTAS